MKVEEILNRANSGTVVTIPELAFVIVNHVPSRMDFCTRNNPILMNKILRLDLGLDYLPFDPNIDKMLLALSELIKEGNQSAIEKIKSNFKLDLYATNGTANELLISEIQKYIK